MGDPLSTIASAIAVVQITEKFVSLCATYIKEVKHAKADIERLHGVLLDLQKFLTGARKFLAGPHGSILETSQQLQSGLDSLFSDVEKLKTKLDKAIEKGQARFRLRRLKWPFQSKEVNDIIQNLNKHQASLTACLNIDQTSLLLANFERIQDDEQLKILKWISPVPYGKHHDTVKDDRTSDTCEWLLRTTKFREWVDAESSLTLWLQGSPGAGKTFLTSRVIDHVQSQLQSSPDLEGFAFFYCNRNEEERRKPLSVLQSYTRQLSAAVGRTGEIDKNLRKFCKESQLGGKEFGFEACKIQLLASVNLYKRTTLVLDALDECEPDSRLRLIETVEFLLSNTTSLLRVFISSQPDGDIRARLLSKPNIEIQATDNKDDIKKFVSEEIVKHDRWGKMFKKLRDEILQTLLSNSERMFQWAFLQIKQLLEIKTETGIRDRLGKLPTDLKAAYDEIYASIAAKSKNEKNLVERAFMWVMCACEPLTSAELLSAVRLDPNDITSTSEEVDKALLLDLCRNLLVLDSRRNVWRVSHLSVTEYFEKYHWSMRQAHCLAAKTCLGVLIKLHSEGRSVDNGIFDEVTDNGVIDSLNDSQSQESQNSDNNTRDVYKPQSKFEKYVYWYWLNHVHILRGHELDSAMARLLMDFLGSPGGSSIQYQKWHRTVESHIKDADSPQRSFSLFDYTIVNTISPPTCTFLLVCRFGLYPLLPDWHSKELPLDQTNESGDSLLVLASLGGCQATCEVLLQQGMQVDLQCGNYGSALAAAACKGNVEMAQHLVEKGADANLVLQCGNYGSALAAAAYGKETEMLKYLIHAKADVDLRLPGLFSSALAAAADTGWKEGIQILKDAGADESLV